jgi:thiosulfate reductase cytochrome b subunit
LYARYFGNALLASAAVGFPLTLIFAAGASRLMPGTGLLLAAVVGLADALFAQFATCASQVFQAAEQMQFTAALVFLNNLLRFLAVAIMTGLFRRLWFPSWSRSLPLFSASPGLENLNMPGFASLAGTRLRGWCLPQRARA